MTLKEFLALPAQEAGEDFRARRLIREWALGPEQGGLPDPSGRSFANWIHHDWADWAEDPELTALDILQGAVETWCGGRTF